MLHLINPNLNVDFLGKSKPFVWLSTLAAVLSIVGLFTKGLNYGIDFTGGTEVQLKVPADWDIGKLRDAITTGGIKEPKVVQIGTAEDHEYLVKVQSSPDSLNQVSAQVSQILAAKMPADAFKVEKVDVVGPQAGANLRTSAVLSIFLCGFVHSDLYHVSL